MAERIMQAARRPTAAAPTGDPFDGVGAEEEG